MEFRGTPPCTDTESLGVCVLVRQLGSQIGYDWKPAFPFDAPLRDTLNGVVDTIMLLLEKDALILDEVHVISDKDHELFKAIIHVRSTYGYHSRLISACVVRGAGDNRPKHPLVLLGSPPGHGDKAFDLDLATAARVTTVRVILITATRNLGVCGHGAASKIWGRPEGWPVWRTLSLWMDLLRRRRWILGAGIPAMRTFSWSVTVLYSSSIHYALVLRNIAPIQMSLSEVF